MRTRLTGRTSSGGPAGEVGVNISADHLVCDLTPFDSMAQRFGRVNRFGDGDAQIDVVYCASRKIDPNSQIEMVSDARAEGKAKPPSPFEAKVTLPGLAFK